MSTGSGHVDDGADDEAEGDDTGDGEDALSLTIDTGAQGEDDRARNTRPMQVDDDGREEDVEEVELMEEMGVSLNEYSPSSSLPCCVSSGGSSVGSPNHPAAAAACSAGVRGLELPLPFPHTPIPTSPYCPALRLPL